MMHEFVANRISQLLAERNLSEYELSYKLGKSKGYIQKITSKKALPSLSALLEICDFFKITPSEFFHDPNQPGIDRKPLRELIDMATQLDNSDINILLTLTRDFKSKK